MDDSLLDSVPSAPATPPVKERFAWRGIGVLVAIVVFITAAAVVAIIKQQPVTPPQTIAMPAPSPAPSTSLLQNTWNNAAAQVNTLLQPAPVVPPVPAVQVPTPTVPLDNATVWGVVQRVDDKMPQLVAWRATQSVPEGAFWWQRTWAQIAGAVVYKPAQPAVTDLSVESVLVRLQHALLQRNKTAYAVALSQLRPAERAMLDPLPAADSLVLPQGVTP